jgi:hypothetical protein
MRSDQLSPWGVALKSSRVGGAAQQAIAVLVESAGLALLRGEPIRGVQEAPQGVARARRRRRMQRLLDACRRVARRGADQQRQKEKQPRQNALDRCPKAGSGLDAHDDRWDALDSSARIDPQNFPSVKRRSLRFCYRE